MGKILAAKYLKLENLEYLSATKIVHNSIKSFLKTKVPVNTDTCQEGELLQQQQSYWQSYKPASVRGALQMHLLNISHKRETWGNANSPLRLVRLITHFHQVLRSSFPGWRCSAFSPDTTLLLHLKPNSAMSDRPRKPSSSRSCHVEGIPFCPAGLLHLLRHPFTRAAGRRPTGAASVSPSRLGWCRSPHPTGL